jgi:hypothetical protein
MFGWLLDGWRERRDAAWWGRWERERRWHDLAQYNAEIETTEKADVQEDDPPMSGSGLIPQSMVEELTRIAMAPMPSFLRPPSAVETAVETPESGPSTRIER